MMIHEPAAITKTAQGWEFAFVLDGQRIARQFIGYRKADAMQRFQQMIEDEHGVAIFFPAKQ